MAMKVKSVPEGFTTLTAHIVVKGAAKALEFYKKAFGAEEIARMEMPGGSIGHAEMQIGNARFMLCDEFTGYEGPMAPSSLKGTTLSLHLYLDNVDAAFKRAVDAGARSLMPPADMFWGDRYSKVVDPFGHVWGIATHIKDVSPAECAEAAKAFFAQSPPKKK